MEEFASGGNVPCRQAIASTNNKLHGLLGTVATGCTKMGTKILMAVMLAILAGAIYVGYVGWTEHEAVELPAYIYVALGLGTFFTLLVGCGLMALVFFSSRQGYDDAAAGPSGRHPRADDRPSK